MSRAAFPHTEGTVESNGVAIHYEVYGHGSRTIAFVPSWSLVHSRAYKAQIPYFSQHFRVVAWDPRGNGKSDRPIDPEKYHLRDYIADALAVLDVTETDSASLVGWSMSAVTATALAALFPERVDAVVTLGAGGSAMVDTYEYKTWDAYDRTVDPATAVEWEKYSRDYWMVDFPDFADFFLRKVFNEPHSTKQIEDSVGWASETDAPSLVATMDASGVDDVVLDEAMHRSVKCPFLVIHGDGDVVSPMAVSERVAELTGGELMVVPGAGHAPHARFPALINTAIRDFLARHLGTYAPQRRTGNNTAGAKKVLYLSSPIGLGHARRDLAIAEELRILHPETRIDWLSQDPVTRFLAGHDEYVHPASSLLASESGHIESEAGEHDLNAFQAIRRMDEILVNNFMIFQEVLEEQEYDLVVADEAWDVDHYWHEHPNLKQAPIAWLTDFVGWVPMPEGGDHEAFLTADYNAEMIGHVEDHPTMRDRAIFVGNPDDIVPLGFGAGLPTMRDWIPAHFDFCGYVLGRHPDQFDSREELRARFGWGADERICLVSVGGSGVGGVLIRRILESFPIARRRMPELRMIVVTGPRLDPASFELPDGAEAVGFVPDLDQQLSACDLALVQGGLTTTMELAAAGTPFLYFPLRNHFEQNVHVAHRLDQYGAGRKMVFADSNPDCIAEAIIAELTGAPESRLRRPVEADGATRAARMVAELL